MAQQNAGAERDEHANRLSELIHSIRQSNASRILDQRKIKVEQNRINHKHEEFDSIRVSLHFGLLEVDKN